MRGIAMVALLACAACAPEPAAKDGPVDYAAINEAAEAPAQAITPDAIRNEDIARHDLSDAGCSVRASDGETLLLIARMESAHFILDGELVTLSPRPGSAQLPYAVVADYDGLAHSLELAIDRASERKLGPETFEYEGRAVIRDEKERVVFEHAGPVRCGA